MIFIILLLFGKNNIFSFYFFILSFIKSIFKNIKKMIQIDEFFNYSHCKIVYNNIKILKNNMKDSIHF